MERFTTLVATACPLGLVNIDTDQLISARFMKRSRADGYGGFLLHDLRFDRAGVARPDFVLNDPRYASARVLVTRRNFGSGSSREAAVYALWDYGIRCVIAPSFGDIFASNAAKNGMLTASVSEGDAEAILAALAQTEPVVTVDLATQVIRHGTASYRFDVPSSRRQQLLNGWDDIDMTQQHGDAIRAYRQNYHARVPWAFPREH